MGSKKKKGSKVTVNSHVGAVQPAKPDMSKYARAYSNKSKINYAELKLLRPAQTKSPEPSDEKKGNKNSDNKELQKDKAAKSRKENKPARKKAEKEKSKKAATTKESVAQSKSMADVPKMSAEERYSNALGKEDHYSSAVEKYYLKYPDAKRPSKSASSRRAAEPSKKKKRRSADKVTTGSGKRSMAEIAVRNKGTSSVKEHARAARNATARGVISPKVGNRSFYRRKKKRSGALNVLMVTLLLVFLTSVGVTVFFNIRTITVSGDNPYGDAMIKNICGIRKGSNILFLSSEEIENRVEKELLYISECKIERKLPSSVIIKVKKADVLGVAESTAGQWAVISTEGKILEKPDTQTVAGNNENTGTPAQTPDFSSVSELAESRKLPLLTGVDIRLNVKEGFITDESQLEYIRNFAVIKKSFEAMKMRLTAIKYGEREYEAEFDKRMNLIFGKEIDEKTVAHRLEELHALIYEKGYIAEDEKGEVNFSSNKVFFRREYEISEEEIDRIHEERRQTNRRQLYEIAEIFMTAGDVWYNGRLKTE